MKLFFKQVQVFFGLKVKEFLECNWSELGGFIVFGICLFLFFCVSWFVLTCIGLLHTYINPYILNEIVNNSNEIFTYFFVIGFVDIFILAIFIGASYCLETFFLFLRRNWIEAGRIVRG